MSATAPQLSKEPREPDPRFKAPASPLEVLTDKRAMVDAGLAPVVFIVVNTFAGLTVACVAAIAVALVLCTERLIRRQPVINAVGGLLGTGVAVAMVAITGKPEGFFWPQVVKNGAFAAAFVVSIVAGHPLVGLLVRGVAPDQPDGFWHDRRVRRVFAEASLAWVALFLLRAVVYSAFILAGQAEALGGVVLVLGYPAFGLTLFFCFRWIPHRLHQQGIEFTPLAALKRA